MKVQVSILLVCLLAVSFAHGAGKNHRIVLIDNLIDSADKAEWRGVNGAPLSLEGGDDFSGVVSRGVKKGGDNGMLTDYRSGEITFDENTFSDTLDIGFAPTLGRRDVEVRGSYTLRMPNLKHIQLELRYDKFNDEFGQRCQADFFVEVFERGTKGEWTKAATLYNEKEAKVPALYTIDDDVFSCHQDTKILTDFAGKEVRIDLVGQVSAKSVTTQRGRWITAKLVGSTFGISFEDITIPEVQSAKTIRSSRNMIAPKTISFTTWEGTYETIPLTDVGSPEGLGVAYTGGCWFGYPHGRYGADAGSVVFDFRNLLSTYNLFNTNVSLLNATVLRGTTVANAIPGTSGAPFNFLEPVADTWYRSYVGMGSAIEEDRTPGNRYLHGFLHAEERRGNSTTAWRIGYARSSVNHGYDFRMMPLDDHTEADYILGPFETMDWTTRSMGTQAPCVISRITSGTDYFYLFYGRNIMNKEDTSIPDAAVRSIQSGICAARAEAADVVSVNYEENPNPWNKFYNGNWNSPPTGSSAYSTPVIQDSTGSWRNYPQVIYNELLENYMMVCTGDNEYNIYIYTTNNFEDWGQGLKLKEAEDLDLNQCHCNPDDTGYITTERLLYPKLVGYTGSDKTAIEYSGSSCPTKLYYSLEDGNCCAGGHTLGRQQIDFYE